MDENERLKQIQKINEYFESKKTYKVYEQDKIRKRRDIKWDNETQKTYRKEYYRAHREKLRAYAKLYYERKKRLYGHHTDL